MAKEVNKEEFDKLLETDKTLLVDFSAGWCGPCQMMAPIVDELAKDLKDDENVAVVKVDIDAEPELAASYNVMGVPTFLVIEKGAEKARQVGATTKENLLSKLKS